MFRGFRFPKWATRSNRRTSKLRQHALGLSKYNRPLLLESLENRCMLSATVLNVVLISDAVAQAQQIRATRRLVRLRSSITRTR